MTTQEVASAVTVDCRTSNLPQLVADTNGEPAILFGGVAKLSGALVREHLEEAVRLLRMHDLGATVYPGWRENPPERRYTLCSGSGEFTDRTLAGRRHRNRLSSVFPVV